MTPNFAQPGPLRFNSRRRLLRCFNSSLIRETAGSSLGHTSWLAKRRDCVYSPYTRSCTGWDGIIQILRASLSLLHLPIMLFLTSIVTDTTSMAGCEECSKVRSHYLSTPRFRTSLTPTRPPENKHLTDQEEIEKALKLGEYIKNGEHPRRSYHVRK